MWLGSQVVYWLSTHGDITREFSKLSRKKRIMIIVFLVFYYRKYIVLGEL